MQLYNTRCGESFTAQSGHLLLNFSDQANNVKFKHGNISQFESQSSGETFSWPRYDNKKTKDTTSSWINEGSILFALWRWAQFGRVNGVRQNAGKTFSTQVVNYKNNVEIIMQQGIFSVVCQARNWSYSWITRCKCHSSHTMWIRRSTIKCVRMIVAQFWIYAQKSILCCVWCIATQRAILSL